MVDGDRFTGMLLPCLQGKGVAILAQDRPMLVPTFADLAMLELVLKASKIEYDEVRTIIDGNAFVQDAVESTGSNLTSAREGNDGRCLTLVIEVPHA